MTNIELSYSRIVRVVLDTNVIISGLNFAGNERRVLELGREGGIEVYLSPFILQEVMRKFYWAPSEAERAIRLIAMWATIIEPSTRLSVVTRDETDNRILECAVDSQAQYLVSGDKDLLSIGEYRGIQIVRAGRLLRINQ